MVKNSQIIMEWNFIFFISTFYYLLHFRSDRVRWTCMFVVTKWNNRMIWLKCLRHDLWINKGTNAKLKWGSTWFWRITDQEKQQAFSHHMLQLVKDSVSCFDQAVKGRTTKSLLGFLMLWLLSYLAVFLKNAGCCSMLSSSIVCRL